MIAYLKGQVLLTNNEAIIITQNIGYGVHINQKLLSQLQNGQEIELFIYTHVREDKLELYGFSDSREKELFTMLLAVSGVGPSTALNLVSLGKEKIVDGVQNAQITIFTSIPRVGKKLAQKIIIDLKSKLGELKALDLGPKSIKFTQIQEALLSLGFEENRISEVLENLDLEHLDESTLIKQAIAKLK